MNRTIMAVGAHADDIELNVGGTLLKYRDQGYGVVYVMATNNMSGCWSEVTADGKVIVTKPPPQAMMARRKAEAAAGAERLGTTPIHLDHPQRHYNDASGNLLEVRYGAVLPDGVPVDVPTILTAHEWPQCQQQLADLILAHQPEWVLTHSLAQQDMEHLGTALLVTRSFQLAVKSGYAGGVLHWREGFTHLGELNARWDIAVDISDYLERKIELIALHRCQIPRPHAPNFPPRQRALWWGEACGCAAAEVYAVIARGTTELPR